MARAGLAPFYCTQCGTQVQLRDLSRDGFAQCGRCGSRTRVPDELRLGGSRPHTALTLPPRPRRTWPMVVLIVGAVVVLSSMPTCGQASRWVENRIDRDTPREWSEAAAFDDPDWDGWIDRSPADEGHYAERRVRVRYSSDGRHEDTSYRYGYDRDSSWGDDDSWNNRR